MLISKFVPLVSMLAGDFKRTQELLSTVSVKARPWDVILR